MKKFTTALALLLSAVAANAQDTSNYPQYDYHVIEVAAVVFTFVLIAAFILVLINRILDHRLKNKVIDKQVTEGMALSILGRHDLREARYLNVKWFAILAGIGVGLLIVNYTKPLGIHSLAIMFLSIAASFLGYHLFLRGVGDDTSGRI